MVPSGAPQALRPSLNHENSLCSFSSRTGIRGPVRPSVASAGSAEAAKRLTLLVGNAPPRQVFAFSMAYDMNLEVWRARAYTIILSPKFDMLMGFCVIANAVVIGLEMDLPPHAVPSGTWSQVEWIFLGIFCLEMFLRIYAFRCSYFKCVFHLLDATIVLAGIVSATFTALGGIRKFQMLKIGRLLRVVRILRVSTQFNSLWVIVQGLGSCMPAVIWTMILLTTVCYFFGIVAVEYVTNFDPEIGDFQWGTSGDKLKTRFTNLVPAIVTLLEFFDIDNISDRTFHIIVSRPVTLFFLLLFILLVPIVLLNLITAVIVEMSVTAASRDQEHIRAMEVAEWNTKCAELELLFASLMMPGSPNASKRIGSAEAYQAHVQDVFEDVREKKLTKERLQEMCQQELVREKLNLLFAEEESSDRGAERLMEYWVILDSDCDGSLSMSEFTEGLAQLHSALHGHNSSTFCMVRVLNELHAAKRERLEQRKALQKAEKERALYLEELREFSDKHLGRLDLQKLILSRLDSIETTQHELLRQVSLLEMAHGKLEL